MNNLKCLKQGFNNKLECKKDKNRIPFKDCNNCPYKEYKDEKCTVIQKNCAKMKSKSRKIAKLERERTSLFTDDLDHCIICGRKKDHLHEVYPGAYRIRSIKEHAVLPLCAFHHKQMHNDTELNLYWKRSYQELFEESHSRDEFINIFGRSYL